MRADKKLPDCHAVEQLADEVVAALAWHDGDALATIRTLLTDCRHLREELTIAKTAMSIGFTRGWLPSGERQEVSHE